MHHHSGPSERPIEAKAEDRAQSSTSRSKTDATEGAHGNQALLPRERRGRNHLKAGARDVSAHFSPLDRILQQNTNDRKTRVNGKHRATSKNLPTTHRRTPTRHDHQPQSPLPLHSRALNSSLPEQVQSNRTDTTTAKTCQPSSTAPWSSSSSKGVRKKWAYTLEPREGTKISTEK